MPADPLDASGPSAPPAGSAARPLPPLTLRSGRALAQPLFLPVYQPRSSAFQLAAWHDEPAIEGIIVNAFFLYKQRDLRQKLTGESSLHAHVGFDGMIATDSGAFQGFTRTLYLNNKDIIRFQDRIGADIIAPLDLVTPPGDKRKTAEEKLAATEKRIAEGLKLVERGILAGVQQGGRFLDLRHRSICRLMELEVDYVAIGSLVPFFNKNHDMGFVAAVLRDARQEMGPELPMHIYGAGDPCELPFMLALGATIFDSASYGHFARDGWYMTPYGALKDPGPLQAGEFRCACPVCRDRDPASLLQGDTEALTRHNLWTLCATVDHLRHLLAGPAGGLEAYLQEVLARHQHWFPGSALRQSWLEAHE